MIKWLTIHSEEYKRQAKECWHLWFAWYPVVVKKYPDGAAYVVWLTTVQRKGKYELLGYVECGWVYEYKMITSPAVMEIG